MRIKFEIELSFEILDDTPEEAVLEALETGLELSLTDELQASCCIEEDPEIEIVEIDGEKI